MKKVFFSIALGVLSTAGMNAQTGTPDAKTNSDQHTPVDGEQHCLSEADEQTWSTFGLTADQITRVNDIQRRYQAQKHHDRGTEDTMRGTLDDRATPATATDVQTGTIGTDRATGTNTTEGSTTGTDRNTGTTGGTDRHATTTGTTSTARTGGTGTDRTSGTTGTTTTSETDRNSTTTGTDRTNPRGTTGTTGTERETGTTGSDTHGTTRSTTETYGNAGSTRTTDQLGYDDTYKESMERELRTVLTTEQFDRYQAWCQDQDASRGDRNMDMDR